MTRGQVSQRTFVSVFALAACAQTTASAWTHGVGPGATLPIQVINFGEKTLAGAGGAPLGSTAGVLSIIAQTCSTNGHSAFTLDGNAMLVPTAFTAGGGYLAPGAVPPAGGGDCFMTVTNGIDTAIDIIHSVAGAYSVRGLPGAAAHADDYSRSAGYPGYTYQLNDLLKVGQGSTGPGGAGPVSQGSTLLLRAGWTNPNAGNQVVLTVPNPVGGKAWGGSGGIAITCEDPATGLDAQGNPNQGGDCQFGPLSINWVGATTDVTTPLTFSNVSFYADGAGLPANYSLLKVYKGVTLDHVSMEWGPNDPNAVLKSLLGYVYGGSDTTGGADMVVTNSHFRNGQFIQVEGYNGASTVYPRLVFQNNVVENMLEKGLSIDAQATGSGSLITDNLFYNNFSTNSSHGDTIITNNRSYTGTGGTAPTLLRNIVLHGTIATGAINTVSLGSATATPLNGSYIDVAVTGGSGKYGYLDLSVSGGAITAVFAGESGGLSQGGGRGYQAGDTIVAQTGNFQGYLSGNTLTASAYVGSNIAGGRINLGDTIYGPGIAGAPAITAQVSGTPGQAGVYTFSGSAQTVGGPAGNQRISITSGPFLTFTVASVQGSPDQIPFFLDTGTDGASGAVIDNNLIDMVDGDTILLSYQSNGAFAGFNNTTVHNNDAVADVQSLPNFTAQVGVIKNDWYSGGGIGAFDANITNSFNTTGMGVVTSTNLRLAAETVATYQKYWPHYDQTKAYATGYNRANAIKAHTPSPSCLADAGGPTSAVCPGKNSDGTYSTALWPADNAGVVAWAQYGVVFDPTATHTPAQ